MRILALCVTLANAEPPPYDPNVPYELQRPSYKVLEHDPEPLRGRTALGFGIAALAIAAPLVPVGAMRVWFFDPNFFGYLMFGTGAVLASLGTAAVIVGAKRHGEWKAWTTRNPRRASRLQLAPTGWANRESFGLVIAGRF